MASAPDGVQPRPRDHAPGRTVALVLLGLLGVGTAGISALGASLGLTGGACLDGGCTMWRIETGWILAAALPVLTFLIAAAATVALVVQRRASWWVPLAAGPAVVAAFGLGWMVWMSGLAL